MHLKAKNNKHRGRMDLKVKTIPVDDSPEHSHKQYSFCRFQFFSLPKSTIWVKNYDSLYYSKKGLISCPVFLE